MCSWKSKYSSKLLNVYLQAAHYVMTIVHGEAKYLPDFLDYFSIKFPSAPVKMEILGKKDIETTTMANFYSQVGQTQ